MRKFYQSFPISHTLCDELSWSHYRLLISVGDEEARAYYLEEARKSLWSVRELQRQINSFYYERLLENRAKKRGGKKAAIMPLPKAHRSRDEAGRDIGCVEDRRQIIGSLRRDDLQSAVIEDLVDLE